MNIPVGIKIIVLLALDPKRVSNRTRNKLHEHGGSGFIVMGSPAYPSFDSARKWIPLEAIEKNVSLSKWGQPGEKEAWRGWLPMDEIKIKFDDNI